MSKKKLSDKEIIEKYAELKQSLESLSEMWTLGLGVSISTGGLFLIVLAVPILIIISIFMLLRYFWKKKMLQANMEISFKQAKSRFEFISDNIAYLPMIKQVCSLNPNARPGQVALIKEWYGVEDSIINEFIFDDTLSDEDLEFYKKYSKKMTLSAKKAFAHKLFKLAIVEDGIHNDEWNLLMNNNGGDELQSKLYQSLYKTIQISPHRDPPDMNAKSSHYLEETMVGHSLHEVHVGIAIAVLCVQQSPR